MTRRSVRAYGWGVLTGAVALFAFSPWPTLPETATALALLCVTSIILILWSHRPLPLEEDR